MAQAESVSLSGAWKNLVQNGTVDISTISDESLAKNIKEYQSWYDKAQDCLKTQQELNKSLNELESKKFTNLQNEYESIIDLIETQKSLIEGQITVLSNGADYDRLRGEQNNIIANLRNERSALEATLNSLSIERGTEEWNNLQSSVVEISKSLQDAEKSLRDINRMQFDNLKQFYELSINLMEKQKDLAENRITLLSGSKDYESLRQQQQKIITGYDIELKKLNELKNSSIFSGMSYEDQMDVLSDIQDVTGSLEEARNALKEISQLEFNNIKEAFEFEKSSLEHRAKLYNEQINLAETRGLFASARAHTDKKYLTRQQLSATQRERRELEAVRDASGYEIGTSEWNSMTSEIMSLYEQEASLTTELEEINNTLRELDWEVFDHLTDSVNDLISESDFLKDLMEYGKLIDDKGKFTDEGNIVAQLPRQKSKIFIMN